MQSDGRIVNFRDIMSGGILWSVIFLYQVPHCISITHVHLIMHFVRTTVRVCYVVDLYVT